MSSQLVSIPSMITSSYAGGGDDRAENNLEEDLVQRWAQDLAVCLSLVKRGAEDLMPKNGREDPRRREKRETEQGEEANR